MEAGRKQDQEISEAEWAVIKARVWKRIETSMLAKDPKFLETIGRAGGGRGEPSARRSPPAEGNKE